MKKLKRKNGLMIVITGGIASGKSYLLRLFKRRRFCTLNTDKLAWQLMLNDLAGDLKAILELEKLDRSTIRRVCLGEPNKIKIVEELVQPLVRQKRTGFIYAMKRSNRSCIIETALFFEKPDPNLRPHKVLLTLCSTKTRQKRMMRRRSSTAKDFKTMDDRQIGNHHKLKAVDFVLRTDSNKHAVMKIINKL